MSHYSRFLDILLGFVCGIAVGLSLAVWHFGRTIDRAINKVRLLRDYIEEQLRERKE